MQHGDLPPGTIAVAIFCYTACLSVCIWKIREIRAIVQEARIQEDGVSRKLTQEEKFALAHAIAHTKGKWFWHIAICGFVLIGSTFLVLKVWGLIP